MTQPAGNPQDTSASGETGGAAEDREQRLAEQAFFDGEGIGAADSQTALNQAAASRPTPASRLPGTGDSQIILSVSVPPVPSPAEWERGHSAGEGTGGTTAAPSVFRDSVDSEEEEQVAPGADNHAEPTADFDSHADEYASANAQAVHDAAPGIDDFLDAEYATDSVDEANEENPALPAGSGAGWTIPLLCLGIGLIACAVVIPQADANRRLAYERQMLQADLESIQKQVAVNDQFLKRVMDDPALAERLAQRQMKTIRKGQKVVRLRNAAEPDMSPFQLIAVSPPPALPPYKPVGGTIAIICNNARSRLYLIGAALTMIAAGLVCGAGFKK